MIFDAYLMVDWSAASYPKPGRDSIWFCFKHSGAETVENPRTRVVAYKRIRELLLEYSSLRVLVGMDFPYGYPAGLAERLGVSNWIGIWSEWHNRIDDNDDNSNNRFNVATDLNRLISGEAGPFWGCHKSVSGEYLLTTLKGSWSKLPKFRLCEPKKAQSAWKLYGAGCVGSQALMGIPYLYALRFDEQLKGESCVWPFETGMNLPDPDKRIVHAEIYPSLFQIKIGEGEIKDKAQVCELARRFHELDAESRLEDYFTGPKLTSDQHNQVKNHEGWILGVMEVRERPDENVQVQEPASSYQVEYTATPGKHTDLTLHAYHHRIETLRSDAEIEGFAVNDASEENFWSFIGSIPSGRKAELVLMDNGNFRAVWKDRNGDHLGVQFLGDQMAEYVIFKQRPSVASVSRVAGIDTLEGVINQLEAFDLDLESLESA